MTVLLDTSDVSPDRRAAAVAEIIRFSSSVPTRTVYDCPLDEVSARFEYFTVGEAHLLKSRNSSQGLVTTPALLKGTESDLITVSLKLAGTATIAQAEHRQLRAGDLFVTDLWRPFEFLDDGGESASFYIPLDRLGLPRDYAAHAGEVFYASPLSAQLQRHFQILVRDADAISRSPAAPMIGQATTDLVRAALVSAADEDPSRHDGWEQTLTSVAKSYISQHLADPDLGADRIARAMFISVRQLYKLWEAEPRPLGQWILERRLDAARDELTSPLGRNQTIAATARRWGFADSTHFSRRFRQAYGMSPREWRHARQEPATRALPPARNSCTLGLRNPGHGRALVLPRLAHGAKHVTPTAACTHGRGLRRHSNSTSARLWMILVLIRSP
jgi:AraC-like DNA-binding protein